MSWFIGFFRKRGVVGNPIELQLSEKESVLIIQKNIHIAVGGNSKTYHIRYDEKSGIVVCGTVIKRVYGKYRLVFRNECTDIFNNNFKHESIDGHFASVKWDSESVILYSDILELRRIYFVQDNDGLWFSTRLDLLANCGKIKTVLNYENMGSFYFFSNSFNRESILTNVQRLGAGGKFEFGNKKAIKTNVEFNPFLKSLDIDVEDQLREITRLPLNSNFTVSLAMSGGVDSRTLLSFFKDSDNFRIHTHGEMGNGDLVAALILAEIMGVESCYDYFPPDEEPIDIVVDKIRNIALQMEMSFSLFHYPIFDRLIKLNTEGCFMLDGGCGEYLRLGIGRSIRFYGKNGIMKKDAGKLLPLFKREWESFFTNEITEKLIKKGNKDFYEAVKNSPDPKEIGHCNWLDYLNINYRLPSAPANSQAFFDSFIPNLMPFIQPSFLQTSLSISANKRFNDKINHKIISHNAKQLEKVPIFRYNCNIPYKLSGNPIIEKIYTKLVAEKKVPKTIENMVLEKIKPYVMDLLESYSVKTNSVYDYSKIKKNCEDYYSGNLSKSKFIYDWISYNFWSEKTK